MVNQVTPPGLTLPEAQAMLVKLDEIISRWHHYVEPQWNSDEFDISIAGSEAALAVVKQATRLGFKARTIIAQNTSNGQFLMSGGIVIPANCAGFVDRVKPPTDTFTVAVQVAPTAAGRLRIYFTEELLDPSSPAGTIGAAAAAGTTQVVQLADATVLTRLVSLFALNGGLFGLDVVPLLDNNTGHNIGSAGNTEGGASAATIQAVGSMLRADAGAGIVTAQTRTASVFKTVSATAAGSTALWTPTAGKTVRLMGFVVEVTANASITAGAAVEVIDLLDVAASLNLTNSVFVPAAAVTTTVGATVIGPFTLGNGKLLAAANDVLNVNLSSALATGVCRVSAWGTEE